ncbi:hypothetical protein R6Q59_006069 [Mikania micrantha]
MSKTPSSGLELPIKRKRGRPRKDESMSRTEKRQIQTTLSPSQPPTIAVVPAIQPPPTVNMNPIGDNHNIVGQVVTGVIDGFFDAGYLISVRVGPNNTLLRGLVFQQGHFCQITPANDVAPNLNMCRRDNFHIPISNQSQLGTPQSSCAKQPSQLSMPVAMQNYQTNPIMTGGSTNELMQVFDVPKMVEEAPKNDDCGHRLKNDNLLSDSVTVENFHKNEIVNNSNLPCGVHTVEDIDHTSAIDDEHPTFEIDGSEKQGEMNKIDVNQVPQGVATDLF